MTLWKTVVDFFTYETRAARTAIFMVKNGCVLLDTNMTSVESFFFPDHSVATTTCAARRPLKGVEGVSLHLNFNLETHPDQPDD